MFRIVIERNEPLMNTGERKETKREYNLPYEGFLAECVPCSGDPVQDAN